MIYAPIIIPTLNRFEHLKQCVESLNACHNANQTEVYISVDYPPSEKYKDGHDLICNYLDNTTFGFKQLHVIKQTHNLGIINNGSKKYDNITFLMDLVNEKYDRWIFSEDDNLFAPGFLDFVNEGLEIYKEDPTVFSICGYNFYYNFRFGVNNFYRQHSDFNAWGCGFWRDKWTNMAKKDASYLKKIVFNPLRVLKIWRVSNMQVSHLAGFSQKAYFKKGDNFYTLYMIDNDMTQIMPAKSLVRNIGWDELGMHCIGFDKDVIEKHLFQEIDDKPTFEGLKGTGWEFFKENEKVFREEDFQRVSFFCAFKGLVKRIICFWR